MRCGITVSEAHSDQPDHPGGRPGGLLRTQYGRQLAGPATSSFLIKAASSRCPSTSPWPGRSAASPWPQTKWPRSQTACLRRHDHRDGSRERPAAVHLQPEGLQGHRGVDRRGGSGPDSGSRPANVSAQVTRLAATALEPTTGGGPVGHRLRGMAVPGSRHRRTRPGPRRGRFAAELPLGDQVRPGFQLSSDAVLTRSERAAARNLLRATPTCAPTHPAGAST